MATALDWNWNALLAEFLERDSTTPTQPDALHRLLTMTWSNEPTTTAHLLRVDETEEKLRHVKSLQRNWKSWFVEFSGELITEFKPLAPIVVANLLLLDLADLREVVRPRGGLFPHSQRQDLLRCSMVMPCFIKTVMAENLKPGEEAGRDSDNAAKLERREIDDDRCIILGTGNPDVCHILPLSINTTEESRVLFRKFLGPASKFCYSNMPKWIDKPIDTNIEVDDDDDTEEDDDAMDRDTSEEDDEPSPVEQFTILCRKAFASKTRVSYRSWNMIYLNAQLHRWWGQALFGLKPLGIDGKFKDKSDGDEVQDKKPTIYTRIKLQWYWMPRTSCRDNSLLVISKDTSAQEISSRVGRTYGDLEEPTDTSTNPVFAPDRQSSISHHVQTGDIFYAKVQPRHAERMLAAFQIKWTAVKILAMAGGAESLRDVGDHPDYLDENLNWIGHNKMGMTIPQLMKEWDA